MPGPKCRHIQPAVSLVQVFAISLKHEIVPVLLFCCCSAPFSFGSALACLGPLGCPGRCLLFIRKLLRNKDINLTHKLPKFECFCVPVSGAKMFDGTVPADMQAEAMQCTSSLSDGLLRFLA